ncbi:MAG: thioredoxin [Thermoleophilia bacterium]|nr:thioredoxin [Thermoleophilia bacterium]
MKEITKDDFDDQVLGPGKTAMVDFWGPRCAPCLALAPQIERLEPAYGDKIDFFKVEAPANRRLCLRLQVLSLPTMLFFKNGEEVDRLAGEVTIGAIEESLKKIAGQG